MNKCSASLDKSSSDLCKIVSTANKFSQTGYDDVAKGFTDVTYMIDDIQTFINSFQNCLNNQTVNQTAQTSIKIIETLDYQLTVKVITGIQTTLGDLAPAVGAVFGQAAEDVINGISTNFAAEFTSISEAINIIKENIQTVIDGGYESVTTADISEEAIQKLVLAVKNLVDTCAALETTVTMISSTMKTLDTSVTIIQNTMTSSTTQITKSTYELDVAVQASKKIFTANMLKFQADITSAFASFATLSGSIFTGDADVQADRTNAELYASTINTVIESVSTTFSTMASVSSVDMTTAIQALQTSISENTQSVVNFMAESASAGASAVSRCLGSTTVNTKTAETIIKTMTTQSTTCISAQSKTAMSSQSLMTFIVGDVVLNAQGAADTLCSCSVGGGKKDKDKSKKCIHKVRDTCVLTDSNTHNILSNRSRKNWRTLNK